MTVGENVAETGAASTVVLEDVEVTEATEVGVEVVAEAEVERMRKRSGFLAPSWVAWCSR